MGKRKVRRHRREGQDESGHIRAHRGTLELTRAKHKKQRTGTGTEVNVLGLSEGMRVQQVCL
ncbi:hypothetical protein [Phaffia rhodozyma]|uniref:Uncharacterized protein n=1 Tax=Phaffia rhodozyma TaxID=264483 RepID=A0A0F7SSD4_PHARH|nr:hypothetical protein [Phaffia rhodozyma]